MELYLRESRILYSSQGNKRFLYLNSGILMKLKSRCFKKHVIKILFTTFFIFLIVYLLMVDFYRFLLHNLVVYEPHNLLIDIPTGYNNANKNYCFRDEYTYILETEFFSYWTILEPNSDISFFLLPPTSFQTNG